MDKTTRWRTISERGSLWGMHIVIWVLGHMGRRFAAMLLYPVCWYFYLSGKRARQASLAYLKRLHQKYPDAHRAPRFIDGFAHFYEFARTSLDRFLIWRSDSADCIRFTTKGNDLIQQYYRQGQGLFFIGAHVGSFDALRAMSVNKGVVVNAVMYLDNARKFNRLLQRMAPAAGLNIINLKDRSIDAMLSLKERVDRGEVVAMLADRVFDENDQRLVKASFLGEDAMFPGGPWMVAHLLECPVFMVAGTRQPDGSYFCQAEEVANPLRITRKNRTVSLQHYVGQFARFLESVCVATPYQWFNFYPFWSLHER